MDQKVFFIVYYFKVIVDLFSFHLCTHEPGTKAGHCKGDSGGPLFLLDSDNRQESR